MFWRKQIRVLIILTIIAILAPMTAIAQSSSNYRVEESQFGTGGEVNMNSDNYNAQGSAGSLGVGDSSSANYDVDAGFLTPSEPFLEFVVSTDEVNLGTLTASSTGTGTSNFYVRTYLSEGYSVVTLGQPPTSEGGAQLTAMATTGVSAPGTDQFGINLVDNSSPDIGANAVNEPSDDYADGGAAAGYATVNQFRYVVGETIARSAITSGNPAVGKTNYTISYIANINAIAPAGSYAMNHDMVVVATY